MSTQIETVFDYQTSISKRNNAQKTKQQESSANAAAFTAFLTQNAAGNSVFTRLNAQLDLPTANRASAENFAGRDNPTENDGDMDAFDAMGNDSSPRDRVERPREQQPSRADERPTAENNRTAARENPAANRPDDNVARTASAAQQNNAKPTTPPQSQAQGANHANPTAQAHANAHSQIVMQAANGNAAVSAAAERSAVATAAPSPVPTGVEDTVLKASVTTQGGQVPSQATSALSAESSVMADAADGAVSNVFTKGSGQNGNTGANGQQNQNPAFNGQGANGGQDPNAILANGAQPQTPATPVNFNTAVAAAQTSLGKDAAVANLAGSSGQVVGTDALTGAAAVEGQNGSIQRAAAPATSHAHRPQMPPQVVSDQVAVNIQRAIGQGIDKINIQLRPQELGRIDVKMEMTQDGRMTAVITAEKPETLDMLRNDARNLIQTLNDAGLQTDSESLSFSLQGQDSAGQQQMAGDGRRSSGSDNEEFSLDGEMPLVDDTPILADGEDVVLDEDGHLNVRV